MIKNLDSHSISNLIILSVLIVQYLAVAIMSRRRMHYGHNGATFAILLNSIALSIIFTIRLVQTVADVPDLLVSFGLFGVMITNFYLIGALQVEAARPLKKQTSTRRNIYNKLDDK